MAHAVVAVFPMVRHLRGARVNPPFGNLSRVRRLPGDSSLRTGEPVPRAPEPFPRTLEPFRRTLEAFLRTLGGSRASSSLPLVPPEQPEMGTTARLTPPTKTCTMEP